MGGRKQAAASCNKLFLHCWVRVIIAVRRSARTRARMYVLSSVDLGRAVQLKTAAFHPKMPLHHRGQSCCRELKGSEVKQSRGGCVDSKGASFYFLQVA